MKIEEFTKLDYNEMREKENADYHEELLEHYKYFFEMFSENENYFPCVHAMLAFFLVPEHNLDDERTIELGYHILSNAMYELTQGAKGTFYSQENMQDAIDEFYN